MEREYLDADLRRLATLRDFRPVGWSDHDVRDFRVLVQCACAAHDDTDLRKLRLLRIESHASGDPNRARATLRSGRAVDLMFKSSAGHGVVVFELSTAEMESP